MSSRTITSVVTPDTIALNAAVFGYAGHSIVTPHSAIQKIWWTDERVEAKVTADFINAKLRLDERKLLDRPLSFGPDLTDETYLGWILRRARRLYLVLVECGVSDQIFGIIDDGWTDCDLPIPLGEVDRLALSYKYDEKLNKRFHSTQFGFLLRPLREGCHIEYAPNEEIPLEFIHRLPPAAALQSWLRVHPPKKPLEIYVRRRFTLGSGGEADPEREARFRADVEMSRVAQHDHISRIWASYVHKEHGYTLTTFESEHTLKSFIEFRSAASLQKMSWNQKSAIFLTWLHCLSDAIASLHRNGLSHSAISPSNIVIDGQNNIAFSEIGSLKSFQSDKRMDPFEPYNYGAPENYKKSDVESPSTPHVALNSYRFAANHLRKKSTESRKSSTDLKSLFSLSSSKSALSLDSQPPSLIRSSKTSSVDSKRSFESLPDTPDSSVAAMPSRDPPPVPRKAMDPVQPISLLYPAAIQLSDSSSSASPPSSPTTPSSSSERNANMSADIFSLGCVFLDILTYLMKKKPNDFIKYRTTKRKNVVVQSNNTNSGADNTNTSNITGSKTSLSPAASFGLIPPNRLDTSFHNDLCRLDGWVVMLENEAAVLDDQCFRAVPYLTRVIRGMLNRNPRLRPSAADVRDRIFDILISHAGLPSLHCCGSGNATTDGIVGADVNGYSTVGPVIPAIRSPSTPTEPPSPSTPSPTMASIRATSSKPSGASPSLMTGGIARGLAWARGRSSTAGLGN